MSTGADCVFEEREPGRWWYRLQRWPYGETEEYDEAGPFKSEEAADDHLHANHANPGGSWSIGYEEYSASQKKREERKVAAATAKEQEQRRVQLHKQPRRKVW